MAIEEDLDEWKIASTKKMYSYGFGYVIINYFLYAGFAWVIWFYEVELGLAIIYLMIAYVIFAIWNMVNDPLLGYLTERPFKWTRKYGFRAPWVIITAFPILILYYFIWTPPAGASQLVLFLWFIIFTCLFDTFFSIFNDHVYGGYTNQFPTEYERRRSFAITTLLLGFGVTGLGVVGSIMIVEGDPSSFVRLAIVVIIIMVVLTVLLLLGVKESDEMKEMFIKSYEQTEQIKFMRTMKTALKTKNFRISLIGYTCQITAMTLTGASMLYMYLIVWEFETMTPYIIPQLLGLATFLGMIPFWSNYAKKKGFKQTYWLCFVLHGISFIPFLFITTELGYPLFYMLICVFALVQGVFYCGEVIMLMPVASDTYDLVSSEIGRRVDATLVGVRTFFFRISFIIVILVIGFIHILTGFDPTPGAKQTQMAIIGIQVHAYLIPAIIMIVMGFVFRKHYTLEGAEKEALVRKLKDMEIYR